MSHHLKFGFRFLFSLALSSPVLAENRAIDGNGNSSDSRGAAGRPFVRLAPARYADGFASLWEDSRPNPRVVTNLLSDQSVSVPNQRRGTDFLWQWGQFVDHDLARAAADGGDFAHIMISDENDGIYPMIPMQRSRFVIDGTGVRQQINTVTSFLDGSMIYGSDAIRAAALRSHEGGRLRMEDDGLLPFNDTALAMDSKGPADPGDLRLAGDHRANEQPGLTALHTVFAREHNRLADGIAGEHPDWDDERIYQRARKINGAILQEITYREWLPALLGPAAPVIDQFAYDPEVDPTLSNEFATAFFRVGHTLVSSRLMRIRDDRFADDPASVGIRDSFFTPSEMADEVSLAHLLKGMACQLHQNGDLLISDDLRNFLFGAPGSGGLDLGALNIQRGREHGLPDYGTTRQIYGLKEKASWEDITSDPGLRQKLADLYATPGDLDLWIGALAEDHLAGSALGELMSVAIAAEFTRLATGDAFFFRWDDEFDEAARAEIEDSSLANVLTRNSTLTTLQDNVFFLEEMPAQASPTLLRNSESEMEIHFMSEPGVRYEIYRSDDLSNWSPVSNGDPMTSGDAIYKQRIVVPASPAETKQFYLLKESPATP